MICFFKEATNVTNCRRSLQKFGMKVAFLGMRAISD